MKKCSLIGAILFVMLLNLSAGLVLADTPWLHVEGNKMKDPSGNVVVLRGVADIDVGATELWEGGMFNLIDRITNKTDNQGGSPGWYPKVIRLAVVPSDSGFLSPWPFAVGDDTFYNDLLRPVVDYCKQKDLYVILDWHYIDNTNSHITTTNQFWTYMAPKFANDSHVLYEIYNEPMDNPRRSTEAERWAVTKPNMQAWVNLIRQYAPNNIVMVGSPQYNTCLVPAITDPVTGTNLVYTWHSYPVGTFNGTWEKDQVTAAAAVLPVFCTEWGFCEGWDSIVSGNIIDYGLPFQTLVEDLELCGFAAWSTSYDWGPPIFNTDWTLRTGIPEMGGFVKDWLYARRNDNLPVGSGANQPPTVSIYSPSNGGSINAGSSVTIQADASDDEAINKVEFFQGSTKIGEDSTSPYSYTWNSASQGTYSITAKATDSDNATTTSAPVTLNVISGAFPAPWVSQDVGGPEVAGYASFSGSTFTLEGSGWDVWAGWDGLQFVYQPTNTNVEIKARVVSVEATDPWAKAGVMIRSSLNGNSVNVFMQVTPASGKMLSSRSHSAGETVGSAGTGSLPLWVRIVRSGSTFTGYSSTNGSIWTNSGSVTIPMAANTFVGLAVTSHNTGLLSMAVFDNVSVIPGSVLTPDTTPPANPAGLSASAVSRSISLNWNDNADGDFDYYDVYRGTNAGGPYTKISTYPIVASDYVDNTVTNGVTYYYVVKAVDMSSNVSGNSNQASATPPVDSIAPAAPTGLTSNVDFMLWKWVLLDWNNNAETDLAGYDIYRGTAPGGPYTKINPSLVTTSDYIDYTIATGSSYFYRVKAVDDSANASGYSNEVSAVEPQGSGTILRQWWLGISGGAVADLTSNANYPNNPTGQAEIASMEGPTNFADNYGSRLIGYVHPSTTGSYTFWVCGDDSSELWMSTDDNPANAVKIAYNTTYANPHEWDKSASQESSPRTLTYGQKYFIMALQKEGGGNDNISVAWEGPGFARQVIAGGFLSPYVPSSNIPPTVSITSPSNGATFTAGANITINATASDSDGTVTKVDFYQGTTFLGTDTSSPYSYTWNNVPAGSYSLTAKATDDDSAVTTSAPVNITVNPAGGSTMHVDSITCSKVKVGNKWKGRAVVVIKDSAGNLVSGASVTGTFTGSYSQTLSATTTTSGAATLTTTASITGTVTFTFCVDNVTQASFTYDSGANVESCDSFSG